MLSARLGRSLSVSIALMSEPTFLISASVSAVASVSYSMSQNKGSPLEEENIKNILSLFTDKIAI